MRTVTRVKNSQIKHQVLGRIENFQYFTEIFVIYGIRRKLNSIVVPMLVFLIHSICPLSEVI
jgi:hypothetical protein